ncbi:MAG: hypothetical protein HC893_11035 [Chloroflexaceae bacterium]|nr:hypothetical protein [Chloroflexaceae bacterium]NJL34293.1 hypothetical protein [Chloroflexaceae bacterium]NJO06806.1 hypothetical protein [Chloroflexaceae bacterium]
MPQLEPITIILNLGDILLFGAGILFTILMIQMVRGVLYGAPGHVGAGVAMVPPPAQSGRGGVGCGVWLLLFIVGVAVGIWVL